MEKDKQTLEASSTFFILIFVSMYTDQTFIWSVKHQPVILKVVL